MSGHDDARTRIHIIEDIIHRISTIDRDQVAIAAYLSALESQGTPQDVSEG